MTARKRSESQQDVPLAVTAVSSEEMASQNISTIADIARIAPGLDQREGRKQGAFAIRGVGQVRLTDLQSDPGVAVYLDGMFLARNDSQLVDTVAIQSVQVLRGPQGTLFGKNSVGGAILVTTKDPSDEFAIGLSSKLDSLGQRDARISIDIPLVDDRLFSKWTFGSIRSDGYAEDVDTGKELGDDDRLLAALQVLWNVNDDMELKGLAYFNKQEENIPPYYCEQITLSSSLSYARTPGRPEAYHEACSNAEKLIGTGKIQTENFGNKFSSRDALFGVSLTWDLPMGTFKSITSYALKGDNNNDYDIDATDLLIVRNTEFTREQLKRQGIYDKDGSRYTLGNELQFSGSALTDRLQYTVGVFASWESMDNQIAGQALTRESWVGFESLPGLPSLSDICTLGGLLGEKCLYVRGINTSTLSSFDNTSYAAFSQVLFDITPTLHITGGLRYSYEKREMLLEEFGSQSVPPPIPGVLPWPEFIANELPITVMTETQFNMLEGIENPLSRGPKKTGEVTFERLSPMMSLSLDVSEHFSWEQIDALMAYVTFSEGFKSGGLNVVLGDIEPYDPEYVISTEVGVKIDALQRRMRLNLALYNSDYKDVQILVTKASSLGAPQNITNNAGLAKMQGAEMELTWLLSDAWMLRASGNYIDARILEYDDEVLDPVSAEPIAIDRSGEPFPYIPRYVYSLSANYSLRTNAGDFDFVLSRNTRSDQFMGSDAAAGLPQFRAQATIDGVTTWSGRATWIPWNDQGLRISLFGNNLADEEYVASGSATYSGFGTNAITLGKVRHIGLELNYEFH
ncbi:TonB-dependent receptor [Zhongshania borealis]|uniref:TonB-dependent receptor n=1 Tax=Zhongshania borealis TaxID=889488 RepID=UPI0031EFF955